MLTAYIILNPATQLIGYGILLGGMVRLAVVLYMQTGTLALD